MNFNMETNTMTDSELLKLARDSLSKAEQLGLNASLPRFVASMLDDSPVTEEALLAIANQCPKELTTNGKTLVIERACMEIDCHGEETTVYSNELGRYRFLCLLTTIGQLRCLLRGLGVTT